MIRALLFLAIFITNLFSHSFDVAKIDSIEPKDYTYFINDRDNIYTFSDIAVSEDLKPLETSHIGGAQGPFGRKSL